MSDADFILWQRRLGYRSLKDVQDSLVRVAAESCSESEFYEILTNNSAYITLRDSIIEGIIQDPIYLRMCNADGYVCIDSVFYRVKGDKVLGTKAQNLEEAKIKLNGGDQLIAFSLANKHVLSSGQSCPNEIFDERLGPDRDRLVQLRIGVKIEARVNNTCHYIYKQCWYVKIDALRKNWLGQWYHYDTDIAYEGIAVSLDKRMIGNWFTCYSPGGCYAWCSDFVYGTPVVETLPETGSIAGNLMDITSYIKFVGDSTQNRPITSVPFHYAKGKAWTRGTTDKNYAKVCCNYACPWP